MADQRSFVRAIRDLTGDRFQRYVTIDAVAEHLGIEPDEAERTARLLDDAGELDLVRVGGGHSIWPTEKGRQACGPAIKKSGDRRPSRGSGIGRAKVQGDR